MAVSRSRAKCRVPTAQRHRGVANVNVSRNDKELLVVKVPESVVGLEIGLHPDQVVTPSYCDNAVEMASGQVELHNVTWHVRRVIYGDESLDRNNH